MSKYNALRFKYDVPLTEPKLFKEMDFSFLKSELYANSLCVGRLVTPNIEKILVDVLKRICIPREQVKAFITSSSEVNASCIKTGDNECFIQINSALIQLMSDEELAFVIGHELGHFTYDHTFLGEQDNTIEYFALRQAQELSADRFGLLACGSLEVALKTILKSTSGLPSKHLRFDIGSFTKQIESTNKSMESVFSTHPMFAIRSRALLWFSMIELTDKMCTDYLDKLNDKIQKDIDTYQSPSIKNKVVELTDDFEFWLVVEYFLAKGSILDKEKYIFEERFGTDTFLKLKKYLKDKPIQKLYIDVSDKLSELEQELKNAFPRTYTTILETSRSKADFIIKKL